MYTVILASLVAVFAVLKWRRRRARPPGPWGLPVVGYLPWLDPTAPHVSLMELGRKYGPIFGLHLGNVFTVVLTDAKLIRRTLAMDDVTGRAPLYLTHGIMQGYGIICAEGDLWKDQRKFLGGCLKRFGVQKFGSKREQLEKVIFKEVLDCIRHIETKSGGAMDPVEVIRHNLGSAMNALVFGISYDRSDDTWLWLQKVQEEGVKHIGVAGPLNFLPFLRFLPKYKNVMKYLLDGKDKTHELYKQIIDERLRSPKQELPGNVLEAFLLEREKRKDTSDVDKYYNSTQFYHLLADVFGAGLDTTLATLAWHFLFMAANQPVQIRVQEELDTVTQGRAATLEDCRSLPLLEASIAETQRIRSVVPMGIPHGTVRDCVIGGYEVPRGAMVVPLQWAVHMDETTWEDPDVYRPERFLDDEGKLIKPENFIPFQTGNRMCIGDELAKMLLFLFTSNILLEFNVSTSDPIDLDGVTGITLSPKPYNVIFTPRK